MLAALALPAIALPAMAQDSGVGVDLHFGNALDPSGSVAQGCDADGMSWLSAERKRSPSGQLYPCVPDFGQQRELSGGWLRSEEHTSELQSLMRISYAVFCLKKKNKITNEKVSTTSITRKRKQNKMISRVIV